MDDAGAVEQAVRLFFGADRDRSREHVGGILREYRETHASVNAVFSGSFTPQELVIHELEVVAIDGDAALVNLRAERKSDAVDHFGQPQTLVDRFDGPVELARVHDGWRVVDYSRNGVRMREATFAGASWDEVGGLSLRVLMGRAERNLLHLFMEVENTGPTAVPIVANAVGVEAPPRWGDASRWSWSDHTIISIDRIDVGVTRFELDAVVRYDRSWPGVRVLLRTDDCLLDARPEGVPRRVQRFRQKSRPLMVQPSRRSRYLVAPVIFESVLLHAAQLAFVVAALYLCLHSGSRFVLALAGLAALACLWGEARYWARMRRRRPPVADGPFPPRSDYDFERRGQTVLRLAQAWVIYAAVIAIGAWYPPVAAGAGGAVLAQLLYSLYHVPGIRRVERQHDVTFVHRFPRHRLYVRRSRLRAPLTDSWFFVAGRS